MNEYRLLVEPSLEVDPQALAEAWREDEDCRKAGNLELRELGRESYEFDAGTAGMGALIVMGAAMSKDLIVILVKRALERADEKRLKAKTKEVEVEVIEDSEKGLPLVVVKPAKD